jgi:hypothetical protein
MIATTKANVFNFIGFILEKVRAKSQIRFGYDVICLSLFVTKLASCKEVPVTERKRLILPCYVLNAKEIFSIIATLKHVYYRKKERGIGCAINTGKDS